MILLPDIIWLPFLQCPDTHGLSSDSFTKSAEKYSPSTSHPPILLIFCQLGDLNWIVNGQTITHAKEVKGEYSQEVRGKKERIWDIRTLWQWDKLVHLYQQNTGKYLNFSIKSCDTSLTYQNIQNYIASTEMYVCFIYNYMDRCCTCRSWLYAWMWKYIWKHLGYIAIQEG